MKDNLADTIRALAAGDQHRSGTARLRDVIDEIENALQAGVSRAAILEALRQHGFSLSMKGFEVALYRIRKSRSRSPAPSTHEKPVKDVKPPSDEGAKAPLDLTGLDKKQRREHLADQFIKPETTNPLLRHLKKENNE